MKPNLDSLHALSAVDGRYREQTQDLADYFSEGALIVRRLRVEIGWLRTILPELAADLYNEDVRKALDDIETAVVSGDAPAAAQVKMIEAETRHDVKAVEYWLGEELQSRELGALKPFIHFACTSWDINNIAFSLQVSEALRDVLLPQLTRLLAAMGERARRYAGLPMLARTHGQAASPTTVGKEFANIAARLAARRRRLTDFRLPAKFNGAVGNYNAHVAAAPETDWLACGRRFVESWDLRFSPYTTQIEPYDDFAELCDLIRRTNNILLDFCRDFWGYVALDYFVQQTAGGRETGSSTMPHKVNPIDFENAEGNLGVANSLLAHFSDKLPVSRWQRDLSDSTVLRATGTAFGHTLIAWRAAEKGLEKLTPNEEKLAADLDDNWQVLAEAVQTVLRREGVADAYEHLKEFSRGKTMDAKALQTFIGGLPLDTAAKKRLLALTPAAYTGLAETLAAQFIDDNV